MITIRSIQSLTRSRRLSLHQSQRCRAAIVLTILTSVLAGGAYVAAQQTTTTRPPQMPPMAPGGRDTATVAPTGSGTLSGTLSNATGGRPVRRATVRLSGTAPVMSASATTDDQGNFIFTKLPAGQFTLTATKPGFLDAVYGQKRTGSGRPGTPIMVAEGQTINKIGLTMVKGGIIAGTVIDDIGEPAYGTRVQALRYVLKGGERSLQPTATTTADDRGMYRMPSLPQGEYVIMATPPDSSDGGDLKAMAEQMAVKGMAMAIGGSFDPGRPGGNDDNAPSTGYAPVFYPGVTQPSAAQTLTLDVGEEHGGLDLQLQLVPMGKITGTVAGDPKAIPGVSVQLLDLNTTMPGLGNKSARVGQDGKFSFTNVPPGQYTVFAKTGGMSISIDNSGGVMKTMMFRTVTATNGPGPGGPGADGPPPPPQWAMQDVAVDGRQPVNVSLVLQAGMTLTGKLAFEGGSQAPADLTTVRVILSPASSTDARAQGAIGSVDAEGHFKVSDVAPGNYKVTIQPPRGSWRTKSIEVEGRDVLDFPLEMKPGADVSGAVATFIDRQTDVSGTLQDSSGAPTADYTVVLFAQDARFWTSGSRRILATRPATDGKFSFSNLPAGDYRIIALNDVEPGQWYDPAVLRQMVAGSIALTIADGDHKIQDIRVAK